MKAPRVSDTDAASLRRFPQDIVRIRAANPSPMTYGGTNTYILGRQDLVIIDPGPDLASHHDAILQEVDGRRVTRILVTHSHRDHSALARRLAESLAAPVLAFGHSDTGRSAIMNELRPQLNAEGGEGVDRAFQLDETLMDGDDMDLEGDPIRAIHTPGHMGNHMCFDWRGTLFSGDHVMGWASSLISPPDGDLNDFLTACHKLLTVPSETYLPGHGAPITEPHDRVKELIAHRETRTDAILRLLETTRATPRQLAEEIYSDIPSALLPAAERNVLAHLIALYEQGRVGTNGPVNAQGIFSLSGVGKLL